VSGDAARRAGTIKQSLEVGMASREKMQKAVERM